MCVCVSEVNVVNDVMVVICGIRARTRVEVSREMMKGWGGVECV